MSDLSILALDTSGSFCSVALKRPDGQQFHQSSAGEGDHFEQLPCLVRAVCDEASVPLPHIHSLRIGLGPGSFTGLRIGMSFAKGLATALSVPLRGTCSFMAAALSVSAPGELRGRIAIVSDARRNEVFIGVYAREGKALREITAPSILSVHAAVELVRDMDARALSPSRGFCFDGGELQAVSSIALGLLQFQASNEPFSLEQIATLEPTYLRGVSAKSIAERRGT